MLSTDAGNRWRHRWRLPGPEPAIRWSRAATVPYKLLHSILAQALQARWPGTEAVSVERESDAR